MIIILRSKYWGAGKTWTALSYARPGVKPVRLNYDAEYRDIAYKSPDEEDHVELAQFAFDFWQDKYGDIPDSLVKICDEITKGVFPYNFIAVDNASLFQDNLDMALRNKGTAEKLARAVGIYAKHENFITRRFRPSDVASYYHMVKGIIRGFLLLCRKNDIDMVVTAESRNVWANYGSRDRSKPPTIEGQTAKLWDPWFQMSDAVLVLDRMKGDRLGGEGKLSPHPMAELDTFNPKMSIPGVLPQFEFKNWDIFWAMAENRRLPTMEEYEAIKVEAGVEADNVIETIADAKRAVLNHALKVGFVESESKASKDKLLQLLTDAGIESDDVLIKFYDCIEAIDDAVEKPDEREG
jgi:hypothetical protein